MLLKVKFLKHSETKERMSILRLIHFPMGNSNIGIRQCSWLRTKLSLLDENIKRLFALVVSDIANSIENCLLVNRYN